MILSGEKIKEYREIGLIKIEPYNEDMVSINSVDICLGEEAYMVGKHQLTLIGRAPEKTISSAAFRDLYSKDNIDSIYEKKVPISARTFATRLGNEYNEFCHDATTKEKFLSEFAESRLLESNEEIQKRLHTFIESIGEDTMGFMLAPREFMIGTTLEEIGSVALPSSEGEAAPIAIVPEMRAKSTTGRHGISVALCAGMGDIGYSSRWALEVHNNHDSYVFLAIGTAIGQVVFHYAYPQKKIYSGKDRYQDLDSKTVRFVPKAMSIKGKNR